MKRTRAFLLATALSVTVVSTTSFSYADGLLAGLFGSKTEKSFKALLSHVPADTAYIFTNKKPIPKEVMDFHLKRSQEMMKMISNMDADDKDRTEKGNPDAFMQALMAELSKKLSDGKIEDSGLSLKASAMIYGFDLNPVIRLTFADKDKILATIKRAEKASEFEIKLSKCGDFDCFISPKAKDEQTAAIVILKDHLAASIFTDENKDKVIDHLMGKSSPKDAYALDKWDAFLKDNNYTGYGDGYLNLQKLYKKAQPLLTEAIKSDSEKKMDDKDIAACMAVAEDHFKNVPEIMFGTTKLEKSNMDYEMVVKTSTGVSDVLQGIANTTNIAERLDNPIFDMGVNINFKKLSAALQQYSSFLVASGEKHKCKNIDANKIRKGMGGLMMGMNMGLGQLKSIYAGVKDVELDEGMSPKKVDAYISIGSDEPAGLLAMVSMMSPAMMGLKIPEDGTPVKLPEGAIPSKGMPLPPIFLSRSAKSLNVMIGNDKPKLKPYTNKLPEMMSFGMDGKRYYEKLTAVMKALPQTKASNGEDPLKMLEKMGKTMGNYQQEITADKRGLVIDYHVSY